MNAKHSKAPQCVLLIFPIPERHAPVLFLSPLSPIIICQSLGCKGRKDLACLDASAQALRIRTELTDKPEKDKTFEFNSGNKSPFHKKQRFDVQQ
jgi:hypothetical protein